VAPEIPFSLGQTVDLSIIIVNWSSAEFLRQCLRTIYVSCREIQFEVIVIDNASFDGSCQLLEDEFPQAAFLQSTTNLGFAGANNAAFEHATGRNILFLNPDTEILGSALGNMVSVLDSTSTSGVVGCKLLNSDGSVQTSCVQRFPTVYNQVLDAELLRMMFPSAKIWGTGPLVQESVVPVSVEVVSGACLMIKSALFEKVGRFTSAYFMYGEDADLCYKVKQAGWSIEYISNAQVIHHGGRSSGARESLFATVMMKQSLCEFIRRRQGRGQALLYRGFMALAASIRLIMLCITLVLTIGLLRRSRVLGATEKWFNILSWALGREEWAKGPFQATPQRKCVIAQ
jgi:N-acetylglucosaminyl-diphospho-decaprenol L-rhamnosyltransferase